MRFAECENIEFGLRCRWYVGLSVLGHLVHHVVYNGVAVHIQSVDGPVCVTVLIFTNAAGYDLTHFWKNAGIPICILSYNRILYNYTIIFFISFRKSIVLLSYCVLNEYKTHKKR
jgi:hypothetical protein